MSINDRSGYGTDSEHAWLHLAWSYSLIIIKACAGDDLQIDTAGSMQVGRSVDLYRLCAAKKASTSAPL
jgi:hypothetical protein